MTSFPRWLAAACAALCLLLHPGAALAQQPALPPIAAFFEPPQLSGAALSPSGSKLALRTRTGTSRARLVVMDLQTMQPTVVAAFDDADVQQFAWANDKRLVFDLSTDLDGPGFTRRGQGLFAVDADGTQFRQLVETSRSFVKEQAVGREPLPWNTEFLDTDGAQDTDEILVLRHEGRGSDEKQLRTLLRLDIRSLRSTEIEAPPGAVQWLLDGQGQLRAVVTLQGNTLALQLRQADGRWRVLSRGEAMGGGGVETPLHITAEGQLLVAARLGRDKTALHAFDPGQERPAETPLLDHPQFDLAPEMLTDGQRLLGLRYLIDAEVTQWLDPALQALQDKVDTLLPGLVNRLSVPRRQQGRHVLVESFSDRQPSLFFLYDTKAGKLQRLGASRPGIERKQMGTTELVRFAARDGLPIPAWLTLPPGERRRGLPMVVLVHGGPWVRGGQWRWNQEVQFLASRGYAVLEPEFRGSTGYGRRHLEAGFKQWGLAMQDDLADGVRWAVAQGHADPQRVCIAGASYGGYAVLMGLARDAELFRCGVSWAGVTDLQLLYDVGWSDISPEAKKYGLPRLVGDPVADAAQLKAASPLQNATRIKKPLLLAHGEWDVRVPRVHGEKFRAAAAPGNPGLEWVLYDKEGHGWSRLETNLDFWGRVERFLARHLAPP